MSTAILSALAEEQQGLIELLEQPERIVHAGRDFWRGRLHGARVVLALSRIGKVAAATTATALIDTFHVRRILFTGVAGGLAAGVAVGDVVVADEFIQHDMNAAPLFPRFEVPLYGRARFGCDPALTALLVDAAGRALTGPTVGPVAASARVHRGLIASGDRFVAAAVEAATLQNTLAGGGHAALAVEMEGAAVAQVCFDYGLPFAAVRTISDRADDTAHVDFAQFVNEVASRYARAIVLEWLARLPAD